jgi:hypothetical protein
MFFILAIGYWQLVMGRLLYALRLYSEYLDVALRRNVFLDLLTDS